MLKAICCRGIPENGNQGLIHANNNYNALRSPPPSPPASPLFIGEHSALAEQAGRDEEAASWCHGAMRVGV